MFLSLYSHKEQCFTYSLQLLRSLDTLKKKNNINSILTWSFLKNVFYSFFGAGVFNLIHSVSADEKFLSFALFAIPLARDMIRVN